MGEFLSEHLVRDWGERYSNWGRFGADDRLGTLNFITPEIVREASLLPRTGRAVSCALEPDDAAFEGTSSGGAATTSWLALSHSVYDGRSYNDRRIDGSGTDTSLEHGTALHFPVVGRGVLLDLPRFASVPWLEGGTRIGPADLDRCAEASGVSIERGDILLVRTGSLRRFRELGSWLGSWRSLQSGSVPGLSVRCAHWIYEREIAALAIDALDIEVRPRETECHSPLQMISVRNGGLCVGTMFDLDLLADACAADHAHAFLFVAPALAPAGADRAPVHPVAIK